MSGLYARIAGLPVRIEGYGLLPLTRPTSSGWHRTTALIRMHGAGELGEGEDVWTDVAETTRMLEAGPVLDLTGARTVDEAAGLLSGPALFPDPSSPHGPLFRRWGFESAVLDLALRQAGMSLAQALDRTPRPVHYVVSIRLGEPSTTLPMRERLAYDPALAFKLDPVSDWDDALVRDLRALVGDRVRVLDFKGLYTSSMVATTPDPGLYRRCLAAWPAAFIEDPHADPAVTEVLAPHWDRVTWDAALHSLEDLTGLPRAPRTVNIKPCRFGGLRTLMSVYDHCEAHGIGMYGGGFFELGPGRGQLQYLASLMHPDAPNDVAPRGHHASYPGPGIPPSPLTPTPRATGFAWQDADPPPADPPGDGVVPSPGRAPRHGESHA